MQIPNRILCTAVAVAAAAIATIFGPGEARAQDTSDGALTIELNAVMPADGGCTIVFLLQNEGSAPVSSAVFEAVLFDQAGAVNRLTLFDFGALPAARPRVRQFVIPELACDGIGAVLINGAQTCTVGGASSSICEDRLKLSSRVDVELIG
ncbi:MAG: hypothetical protein AAGB05_09090 [Pseudomonadota bacterium]